MRRAGTAWRRQKTVRTDTSVVQPGRLRAQPDRLLRTRYGERGRERDYVLASGQVGRLPAPKLLLPLLHLRLRHCYRPRRRPEQLRPHIAAPDHWVAGRFLHRSVVLRVVSDLPAPLLDDRH